MDVDAIGTLAANGGVAVAVLVWLWKGLLPELRADRAEQIAELRAMRAELTAIEKHLAAAGQARVHLEGGVRAVLERLDETNKGIDFLVSATQQRNGRTTRPTDAPEGG